MSSEQTISGWKDQVLFTPGPLTTSRTVKQAMLADLGSRDFAFIAAIKEIRQELLAIGQVASPDYEAVLMQGSGTFGIEAVLSTFTPPDGKWLFIINGAYGRRMAHIADRLALSQATLIFPENQPTNPVEVEMALHNDPSFTHVAVVHCETTTGIMNPVAEIGEIARRFDCRYFVDAMSSFGAVPLDLSTAQIDYLVSSANKCIEGVPGFSFALVRRAALLEADGYARSVSLDLLAQWRGLEKNGQFRFTPPTHTLLAFRQALHELALEGGVAGRADRYQLNRDVLLAGMRQIGFKEYLAPDHQGYIITSFLYPSDVHFDFDKFYQQLNQRGITIYPGKVSDVDSFRIGHIGRIFESDVRALLSAIRDVLTDMQVSEF